MRITLWAAVITLGIVASCPTLATAVDGSSPTLTAQSTPYDLGTTYDLRRAKNLARQAAEAENGGLQQYRAGAIMHGPVSEIPAEAIQVNGSNSVTFLFMGGPPGTDLTAIESEVRVDWLNDEWIIDVIYNGPSRSQVDVTSTNELPRSQPIGNTVALNDTYDLNKAKNLARQTAEDFNGGLSQYRAASYMHGPVQDLPANVVNITSPTTATFTFLGGSPRATLNTIESVVEVSYSAQGEWDVSVIYNGSPENNNKRE